MMHTKMCGLGLLLRRGVWLAVALALWASTADAQVSFVQRRTACGSGCDVTDTFASDGSVTVSGLTSCTVGNALVVVVASDFADSNYTASDGSNTYNAGTDNFQGGEFDFSIKYARCATAVTSITVTASGGGTFGTDWVVVYEFSGMPNPLVLDDFDTGLSSGVTTHTATTVTATVAGVAIGGGTCSNGSYTLESDFATNGFTGTHVFAGYHVLSGAGSDAITATSAASEACSMGTIVLQGSGGGGGGSSSCVIALLGAGKCGD